MPILDAQDAAALAAVLGAIADPDRVHSTWREKDLFSTVGHDGFLITLGAASRDVATVASRYKSASGRTFPPLLEAFLAVHDGLNLETIEAAQGRTCTSAEIDCTNGILPARSIETEELADMSGAGLLIGKAYHQERILWIDEGDHVGAVVFDADSGAVILGKSLADFFQRLVANGLCVESLTGASGY